MSKLITNYKLVQEGKMPKGEFLRQARQEFPGYLSNQNSYEDTVSILRSKGLLSEAVYQNVADKFPLESIEKGIKIELEEMGYEDYRNASIGDYKKAKSLVIDHLVKDPLYYLPLEDRAEKPNFALGVLGEAANYNAKKYPTRYGLKSDVNLTKDPDSEIPETPKARVKTKYNFDPETFHKWTVNDFKIVATMVEYGEKANKAIGELFGITGGKVTDKTIANDILNCTSDALSFAKQGIRKYIVQNGDNQGEDRKKWLQSYFHTANVATAVSDVVGKSLNDAVQSIEPIRSDDNQEKRDKIAQKEQDKLDKSHGRTVEKKKELGMKATNAWKHFQSYQKAFGTDKATSIMKSKYPDEFKLLQKDSRYNRSFLEERKVSEKAEDPQKRKYEENVNVQQADKLFTALMAKSTSDVRTRQEKGDKSYTRSPQKCLEMVQSKFPEYTRPLRITMRNLDLTWETVPGSNGQKKKLVKNIHVREHVENKETNLIKEAVKKLIVKVLSENKEKKVLAEAATANLAQLSDQNATIQGLPAILNNLENVVTEIESFALKETTKIQSIFDSVGNIKNEDGMPIGYQFAQPILDSFSKDLQPVLEKMDFVGSIKLPEAPQMTAEPNLEVPDQSVPEEAPEEKQIVFSPKPAVSAPVASVEPLTENKAPKRRYTA